MSDLMKLTDWQGQEYGPGDVVLYAAMSGRSVTMIKAEVLEVYEVYRDSHRYEWARLDSADEETVAKLREHDAKTEREYDKHIHVRVKLMPLGSSRWEQHSEQRRYRDTRTGKNIDPWRRKDTIKSGGFMECIATGQRLDDNSHGTCCPPRRGSTYHSSYSGDLRSRYIPIVWHDWVEEYKNPVQPVTLTVIENITKIGSMTA